MIDLKQLIEVKWNNTTKKHYIEKGYNFTKIGDLILVTAEDLMPSSQAKVEVVCDYCGNKYYPIYKSYNLHKKDNSKDCCNCCKFQKMKETNKQRYGVEWFTASKEFVEKSKVTCLDKYGVENPSQLDWVQEKKINTNREKYGSDWFVQSNSFKAFCQDSYGVDNPMKSQLIMDKASNTLYANGNVPISKKEQKIYDMLVGIYGKDKCHQSYLCHKFIMDCMLELDDIKIDIEYDGWYWHKQRQNYDIGRDAALKKYGYKILRIQSYDAIPTKEELISGIEYLRKNNIGHLNIKLDI